MNAQEESRFKQLEKENLELRKQIKKLESLILAFKNENTPSSKQKKCNSPPKTGIRFPGKPKNSLGGGIKLPKPDEFEEHKLNCCPNCSSQKLNIIKIRYKRVLDLPKKPIICTENKIYEYQCTECNSIVCSKDIKNINSYGSRIISASTLLKSSGLSFQKIADLFNQLGAISMSAPTVLSFTTKAAKVLSKTRGAILRSMKNSRIAHKDETGLRCDGKSGYTWLTCNNRNAVFFAENSRRKEVAKKLKGKNQISITDCYAGYNDDKLRQLCWSHLLRKAKRYAEKFPDLNDQYTRLKKLFYNMKEWILDPPDEKKFNKANFVLNDIVSILESRKHARPLKVYIKNGGENWLTALKYQGVPLTNNHAERMIRPLVVLRKMMGCYRNSKGRDFVNIILSVFTTWNLQSKNKFTLLLNKLT